MLRFARLLNLVEALGTYRFDIEKFLRPEFIYGSDIPPTPFILVEFLFLDVFVMCSIIPLGRIVRESEKVTLMK